MGVMESDRSLRIERLTLGPYGTNAYILTCQETGESAIVDAPADADTIIGCLKDTGPRYILLTHNHMDHTGALAELRSRLKIPLATHELDSGRLLPPPEIKLNDGDTITIGKLALEVLHTPGHTPGSLCFLVGGCLLAGDTIFPHGPGHTRNPAALEQLISSIKERVFMLPDDTRIYPGHGQASVLEKERGEFAVFAAREHPANLCGDVLWLSS